MKTKTAIAILTLLALFALIQAGALSGKAAREYSGAEILVKGRAISVLLADTELKRIRGLSDRQSLAADEGMLFVFPTEDFHGIWMKEMLFPIDIIWLQKTQINADTELLSGSDTKAQLLVADTKENVLPWTFPAVFYPKEKTQYVLEVPGGFIQANGVVHGDLFEIKGALRIVIPARVCFDVRC